MESYTGNCFGNTVVAPLLFNFGVMQPCVEILLGLCKALKVLGKAVSIDVSNHLYLFTVNVTKISVKDGARVAGKSITLRLLFCCVMFHK